MKRLILILTMVLAVSTGFAQEISVSNTTEAEFGNGNYAKDSAVGLNYIRNATSAEIVSDMFTITGNVRFALNPEWAEDTAEARTEISSWTLTANDDTQINAYIRPVTGFEFAAGTHLEQSFGVETIWWDEEQATSMNDKADEFWGNPTRYVNAGFMVMFTGVENLTAAIVLPTDESINDVDYSTSTKNASFIPMNIAVGYAMPDMFDAGVIAKINVLGTDAMQFTGTLNYLGLPVGSLGAYVSYTTESETDYYDDYMMFGLIGDMNFAGLSVAPEVSAMLPLQSDELDIEGLPIFAKVGLAYPVGMITPALDILYTMFAKEGAENDADQLISFKPGVEYDMGVGVVAIGAEIHLAILGDDEDSLTNWCVPISWTMNF